MSQWYIKLPAEVPQKNTPLRCALLREDGEEIEVKMLTVSSLPAMSDAIIVIPSISISWHKTKLPVGIKGEKAIQQALEGLLEDFLLQEPLDMHLALTQKEGEFYWVAAVSKSYLHSWITELRKAGIVHKKIIPETRPLFELVARAYAPFGLTGATLALCGPTGVACIPMEGNFTWPLEKIICEPSVARYWEQQGVAVEVVSFGQSLIWASQIEEGLDQFEFSTTKIAKLKAFIRNVFADIFFSKKWKKCRWGIVVSLCMWLGMWTNQAYIMQKNINKYRLETIQQVKKDFPDLPTVIDPVFQAKREAEALREQSGSLSDHSLEVLLTLLGKNAPHLTEEETKLSYDQGTLIVEASNVSDVELKNLTESGLVVSHVNNQVIIGPNLKKGGK